MQGGRQRDAECREGNRETNIAECREGDRHTLVATALGIPLAENARIWKVLNDIRNRTQFYAVSVGHSFTTCGGGSYAPDIP